jgi:chromate transporter
MLDGLAMAETTPGPLIQTVQFVGFMGALRFPDVASPYWAAFIGSVLVTWMTFAPCFLWIFTLAPYVEIIREKKILANALKAITAAVVGVIANLSMWFVLKTLFSESTRFQGYGFQFDYPDVASIDIYATTICLIALTMQFKLKRSLFQILSTCMVIGILAKYIM